MKLANEVIELSDAVGDKGKDIKKVVKAFKSVSPVKIDVGGGSSGESEFDAPEVDYAGEGDLDAWLGSVVDEGDFFFVSAESKLLEAEWKNRKKIIPLFEKFWKGVFKKAGFNTNPKGEATDKTRGEFEITADKGK